MSVSPMVIVIIRCPILHSTATNEGFVLDIILRTIPVEIITMSVSRVCINASVERSRD